MSYPGLAIAVTFWLLNGCTLAYLTGSESVPDASVTRQTVVNTAAIDQSGLVTGDLSTGGGSVVRLKRVPRLLPTAEDIVINNSNQNITRDCHGNDVTINGSNNTINLRGDCKSLIINASGNTITVDSVVEIDFNGGHNTVTYKKGPKGKRPEVVDNGQGNKVRQEAR